MPKKLTLISTLTTLAISTLGTTVPAFAVPNEIYYVSDLVPLHAQYANDMAECGAYNRYDSSFMDCYNRITDEYRARYGGKFESMYQLDYNGRMVVTGLNPAAGTVRLYIDETKAYRGDAFTFQNLVAFWADGSANPTPDWDDDVAWDIVDAVLRGEEAPRGIHILYKGVRGEEGWLTPNTEYRTTYTPSGNFAEDSTADFFFILGYDTDGVKHLERNYYYECTSGFTEGNECRYYYTYNGSTASRNYIEAAATPEDSMIIELKTAIKKAEEAEVAAREAETTAREAEVAAREAETEAKRVSREATEAAAEANRLAAEATEIVTTSTSKINELNEKIANLSARISSINSTTQPIEKTIERIIEKPITADTATSSTPTTNPITVTEPATQEEHIEVPMTVTKEPEFPWWIIAFTFSGIALILWWLIPNREK